LAADFPHGFASAPSVNGTKRMPNASTVSALRPRSPCQRHSPSAGERPMRPESINVQALFQNQAEHFHSRSDAVKQGTRML
jgi:hypothetical protein